MAHIPTVSPALSLRSHGRLCAVPNVTARRRRLALLASCAVIAAALALPVAPALAGCNSGNVANSVLLGSAGCQANASGSSATAVGAFASATGTEATAVGDGASATGEQSSAFGYSARTSGNLSTAVGYGAGFHDPDNTAPGYTALGAYAGTDHLLGRYSTTIGAGTGDADVNPRALGAYAIAIGGGDGAGGSNGARADSDQAVAIGAGAVAKGLRSLAVGAFAGDGSKAPTSATPPSARRRAGPSPARSTPPSATATAPA